MSAPSSNLDWTVANPNFSTITVEPSPGKKTTGWTPGEAPPAEIMNWLLYNTDQWIKYFKTTTDSQSALITTLQNSLFSTNLVQEVPAGMSDGVNSQFTLTQTPSSPANLFVYSNSLLVPRNEYTMTGRNIFFNGGSIPAAGSNIQAIYVIQTGFSGQTVVSVGSGSIPKVENRTLTAAEIAAGQLVMAAAPFDPTVTLVDVIEDGPQYYGGDFTITGNVMSWGGLAMAPAVIVGTVVRIQYFI